MNNNLNKYDTLENPPFKITEVQGPFDFYTEGIKRQIQKIATEKGISTEDAIKEIFLKGAEQLNLDIEIKKEIEEIIGKDFFDSLIESEVKEYFKGTPHLITGGSEGNIYTMNIPGKGEVVVIKKIHESLSKNNIEFKNHYKFKKLEKLLQLNGEENTVKIPTPIHHFYDGNSEYIIMEYIPGKTLYTIILEKIVEEDILKYLHKINKEEDKKEFLYMIYLYIDGELSLSEFEKMDYNEILELITDEEGYIKPVFFENDTKAEQGIIDLYKMLYELNIIENNPTTSEIVGTNWVNPFLDQKIKSIMDGKGLGVFSEDTKNTLINGINNFIKKSHEVGLYHRDLGGNPRNIMFVKTKRNTFETYIIDFGKSIDNGNTNTEPYHDYLTGGEYIRDENINIYMKQSSGGERIKLIDKEKENILERLYNIGKKFNLNEQHIQLAYNVISNYKNYVYYNTLIKILESGNIVGGFKLDLGKNGDSIDNSKIFSEIMILMFFTKEENFGKIQQFINNLKNNKNFKLSFKKKIISKYMEIYESIKTLRN